MVQSTQQGGGMLSGDGVLCEDGVSDSVWTFRKQIIVCWIFPFRHLFTILLFYTGYGRFMLKNMRLRHLVLGLPFYLAGQCTCINMAFN